MSGKTTLDKSRLPWGKDSGSFQRIMAPFFLVCSLIVSALLVLSPVAGYLQWESHLYWGLSSAILATGLHCLIFGIFTGSGKDTRELVEDLSLSAEYVKKTKIYKKTVFPKALYAILFLLVTTSLGGYHSAHGAIWMRTVHGYFALFTVYYNLKTFILEYRAIKENAAILKNVNQVASLRTAELPKVNYDFSPVGDEKVAELEWGTHVYAFGRFLIFLAFNTWLPYVYLRYIVGKFQLPIAPFVGAFIVLLVFGYYLKFRYRKFSMVLTKSSAL